MFRFHVQGAERIPREGAGVIVAPHRSWLDPSCVGGACPRPIRFLIMGMLAGQIVMFGLAPHLGDPLLYWVCLSGWGLSGGFYGPLTVAALPNFFGRKHLGSIQGVMMMVIVIASALGPAMLAAVKASFGSYGVGLQVLAFLPLGIFFVAPFTGNPKLSSRQ